MSWDEIPEGADTVLREKSALSGGRDKDRFREQSAESQAIIKRMAKLSQERPECREVNATTLATDVTVAWIAVLSQLVEEGKISTEAADELREDSASLTRVISDCHLHGHVDLPDKAPRYKEIRN